MRGVIAVPVLAVLTAVSLVARQSPQDPPPPQIPPVFRGEVDLIRLDISVLDGDRRPVTGLTSGDFTVIEDGTPQKIAALSEILVAERDPKLTAWMRNAGVDVATNDLLDQLGDGRPYAIVMDDWNIQDDDLFLVHNARAAGREIVARLGPSDVAAVIFVHEAGRTVDFTTNRVKLLDAINGFEGRHPDPLRDALDQRNPEQRRGAPNPLTPRAPGTPWSPGGFGGATGGADMPVRSSEVLGRSDCERRKPLVPALETAARRLAMVPNRRKTIVLVSIGMVLMPGPGCDGILNIQMNQTYGVAEQGNINIYTVDVADDRRLANSIVDVDMRRLFLEDMADYTGGRVVGGNGDPIEASVGQIFSEAGSYYLLGYQSSKGAPDGKYRRIEVRVNRPAVTVRTRSGYFAPTADGERVHKEMDRGGLEVSSLWDTLITPVEQQAARPPSGNSLALSGLYPPAGLPLRVSVVPVGLTATPGRPEMDVAVTLSVRLPPSRQPLSETVTIVGQLYDPRGRPGAPVVGTQTLSVQPSGGDELRYDVFQRMTLAPGRYEMRLNAMSAAIDRGGSVFIPFEVPDVARLPVALSGIVVGTPSPSGVPRTDVLASILPIVPTSARNFSASDSIVLFFHVFQGSAVTVAPVTVKVRILDRRDLPVVDTTETIGADAFALNRSAAQQITLPLARLTTGPYLLTITVTRPEGATSRREVVFRVR